MQGRRDERLTIGVVVVAGSAAQDVSQDGEESADGAAAACCSHMPAGVAHLEAAFDGADRGVDLESGWRGAGVQEAEDCLREGMVDRAALLACTEGKAGGELVPQEQLDTLREDGDAGRETATRAAAVAGAGSRWSREDAAALDAPLPASGCQED